MRNQGLPLHVNPTMRFMFSGYWGCWSRILQYPTWYETDKRHLDRIEVNVTPLNNWDHEWIEIGRVWIRRHGTQFNANDKFANVIPMDWYNLMGDKIGEKTRDFILFGDILSQIDWEKWRKHNNGGAPLDMCKKENV